jgi:hypothetical protein
MRTKTIKFKIKEKIDAWLESITDESLREDLRESTIVTGGCIASMLHEDPVNDYDLYFTNKKVVKDLINYYKDPKWPIVVLDGVFKELYKEDWVKLNGYDKWIPDQSSYTMAVENLDKDRVTMYFNAKVGYKVEAPSDESKRPKFSPLFFSANAITLTDEIQLITRFHGSPAEIHKNFDFVHATNYYKVSTGELYTNKKALTSLLTRELRYMGQSKYPLTAMIRTRKFQARGYTINAGEMLKIMFQLNGFNLADPVVLSEQLIGVDIAYFNDLIAALIKAKEDPDFVLDNVWIMQEIDRIFDKIKHDED